jgi:hypothetical protein
MVSRKSTCACSAKKKVDEKSNEIIVIPILLESLELIISSNFKLLISKG